MSITDIKMFGLNERDMKTIQSILLLFPEFKQIKLFGSRAKGSNKPGSDIDLAIMDEGINESRIMKLKEAFDESSLPYHVDILHYPSLTQEALKEHINRVGVSIF